ncbi:hypothetical protein CPB86DRAFT_165309 [Serendipita vermifera]|nr:hypothetical protein CPB86DRAFT_165309 [Serendipita vermifera]
MEEFQFLETAVFNLKRDIEVLQNSNRQAKVEDDQNSCIIEELSAALETAHKFREAQDLYISTLESLSSNLEPKSNNITSSLNGPSEPSNSGHIDELLQFAKKETGHREQLSLKIEAIKTELRRHQLALKVSQESINSRKELITTLRSHIFSLMSEYCPFMRLPTEIMVQIFQHRVSQDVDDYTGGSERFLPYTTLILSHVCRPWRLIASSYPSLWCKLKAYPTFRWTNGKIELFEHYLRHSEESSHEIYVEMEEKRKIQPLSPQIPDIAGRYNIHLIIREKLIHVSELPHEIKAPQSLEVHNLSPGRLPGWQVYHLVELYSISRLTIRGTFNSIQDSLPSNLTHLALYTDEKICSMRLAKSLLSAVELYFTNDEWGFNNRPTTLTTLSNLTVLAITPSHQEFSERFQLPALQTVIFYPLLHGLSLNNGYLDNLALLVNRAIKLHIHGWLQGTYDSPSQSGSVFSIEILQRPTRFTSATFSHGFVACSPLHQRLPLLLAQGTGSGATLKEIHFDNCTGVSESDCNRLSKVVERVKVFI